jgi:hypothetical protein
VGHHRRQSKVPETARYVAALPLSTNTADCFGRAFTKAKGRKSSKAVACMSQDFGTFAGLVLAMVGVAGVCIVSTV